MILLDWEKAFDKVRRKGLINAPHGMRVDETLIRRVQMTYRNTDFK